MKMLASHLTRLLTSSCFPREFTILVLVHPVVVQQMTSSTYCLVALILMLLAKWVHYDISVRNIILVKDKDNQQTEKISNLEYAQKFDSISSSYKNLKIVIQISQCVVFIVAKFLQGTLFFMPQEVYSHQRLIDSILHSGRFIDDQLLSTSSFSVKHSVVRQWPPFYQYNYNLESLQWILLQACLFYVFSNRKDSAYRLGSWIFTYTSQPSLDRTHVMQISYSEKIIENIPS